MNKIIRILRHLFLGNWLVRSYFSKTDLVKIKEHIAKSELQHRSEIRFAIESKMDFSQLLGNLDSRKRAIDVFSNLRIWDTEENSGVLIYLLLADHKIEIIADRGIHSVLGHDYWGKIIKEILEYFKRKEYCDGIIYGIDEITARMIEIFPKQGDDPNELSDEVVII